MLLLAVGNPSRGDDALGPAFAERIGAALADDVLDGTLEILTDFQLQVEHALDLVGRREVVFVDASMKARAPFDFRPVQAAADPSFTTHALSPQAVLEAFRRVEPGAPPACSLLAIQAEAFELGEALSPGARANLAHAVAAFLGWWRARRGLEDEPG